MTTTLCIEHEKRHRGSRRLEKLMHAETTPCDGQRHLEPMKLFLFRPHIVMLSQHFQRLTLGDFRIIPLFLEIYLAEYIL